MKHVKEPARCRGLLGGISKAKSLHLALGRVRDTDTLSATNPKPTAKRRAVKITKVQVG